MNRRKKIPVLISLGVLVFLGILLVVWSAALSPARWAANSALHQNTASDCGPKCLQFLFKQSGVFVPLEDIRRLSGTTARGTSMLGMKHCAEHYGFHAAGYRVPKQGLQHLSLPVIVFLDGGHFTILQEVHRDAVFLVDPQFGRFSVSPSHFLKRWDGRTLVVRPKQRR